MFIIKTVLYGLTLCVALVCGFWEMRLKERLTDDAMRGQVDAVSDIGLLHDLSNRMKRERLLKKLPTEQLFKLRLVVIVKFTFVTALIGEVLFLQR